MSLEVFSCHEIRKFEKAQFTNNGVIQLYIAREGSGSGGKLPDPDPAKKVRIQPDQDPQSWWEFKDCKLF